MMNAMIESPEPFDVSMANGLSMFEWFAAIVDARSEDERRDLLNMCVYFQRVTLRKISTGLMNTYKLDRNQKKFVDESESVVNEALVRLVADLCNDRISLSDLRNPTALLTMRAKSLMRVWLDSAAGINNASGQVNMKRKIEQLRRRRLEFVQIKGVEPTPQELLDYTNDWIALHRSDPTRFGKITMAEYDFMINPRRNSSIDEIDPQQAAEMSHDGPGFDIDRMVAITKRACYAESPELGDVADLFFKAGSLNGWDDPENIKDIATELGITKPAVRARLAQVMIIAKDVLTADFGINGVDY